MPHPFLQAALAGENKFSRYIAGIFLTLVAVIAAQVPLASVFQNNMEAMQTLDFQAVGIPESIGFALLLLPFAVGFATLLFAIRFIHQRPILSGITPDSRFDWGRYALGAGYWIGAAALFELIAYFIAPHLYQFTFDARRFFPMFGVALVLLPFQTAFEELLFRGYLLQPIANATKRPWVALIITSVVFGIMHIANPEVAQFGTWIIAYYIAVGLFLGYITLQDQRLELAMGMHAGNNLFGAAFVTFHGSVFSTPAIFTVSEYNAPLMTALWVAMAALIGWLCTRHFKWQHPRHALMRTDSVN